jgi:hypothetical protein
MDSLTITKLHLLPPGTKILIHEKSSTRSTWAPHGLDSWYLGPAQEHYHCQRVYVTKTAAKRIADTVEFFPHQSTMPTTSSVDAARDTAAALTQGLLNPAPATPFATIGDAQQQALTKLADIFNSTF